MAVIQVGCQGMKPPCLRPSHICNFIRYKPAFHIVEKAFVAIDVLQHPAKDFLCKDLIFMAHIREKTNCLAAGVNVYRIDPVVIIFWSPSLRKNFSA